jgi:hypothetical protein
MSAVRHLLRNGVTETELQHAQHHLRAVCGAIGSELADAMEADFHAPYRNDLTFDPTDLASLPQTDLGEAARQITDELTDANKKELIAHLYAQLNGVDPRAAEPPSEASSAVTLTQQVDGNGSPV